VEDGVVVERTRRWVEAVVVGLNLCPFAKRVLDAGGIRYAVSAARDAADLLADLAAELQTLAAESPAVIETTLLIHPRVLTDFLDYNDFLADADRLATSLGLRGTIQVASFHPDYQFAGTAPDGVENYTNRSPYPMLHLLREASVTAAADGPIDLADIPRRNVETMRRLGRDGVLALLAAAGAGRPVT
jgi:hypothetical protein